MKRPPFCPNPNCRLHRLDRELQRHTGGNPWFIRKGTYFTKAHGRVPRFYCTRCRRTFSTQTFSLDYYAKRRLSYPRLIEELSSTSCLRAISRHLQVSIGTVENKISRLARQALAMHTRLLAGITLSEDLAADGFESYTVSQYFPNNIHFLTGCSSQFLYTTNYVTIRRKGRMTAAQKKRRAYLERFYRAEPKGIQRGFAALLVTVQRLLHTCPLPVLTLFTDEKTDYLQALKKNTKLQAAGAAGRFVHVRIPSTRARTTSNPLFPVNYLDRQVRKDVANHVRETVCFARNVTCCMERLWVYFCYHNYYKRYRELQPVGDTTTHAEVAGVKRRNMEKEKRRLFTRRYFLSREAIEGENLRLWKRTLVTPLKPQDGYYVPGYALA
jgi:hypothetical protein